jgi:predicted GTPase
VDYEAILREAENEADVIVWDGGNNDLPFYKPDLHIVVVDPHRAGHETRYHPGEANLRLADVVVINKVDTADLADVVKVRDNAQQINQRAVLIEAASPISVENPEAIRGKRVLVVEDGPTLTHGEMAYGAGVVAAQRSGAAEIVDPRPYAIGSIAQTFEEYPRTGPVLPAMGYGDQQIKELEETIEATPCDLVIIGTPIDLRRVINIGRPAERVWYDLQDLSHPTLAEIIQARFGQERDV